MKAHLSERTRAVADVGRRQELLRATVATLGIVTLTVGWSTQEHPVMVAGAMILGIAFGTLLTGADRSYLEGFADGLSSPLSVGPAAPAGQRTGDRANVPWLPDGPVEDVRTEAAGAPDDDQRGDRVAATGAHGIAALAGALGVELDRRPRSPLDPAGDVVAFGPRSALPPPEPEPGAGIATGPLGPVEIPRPEPSRPARRGRHSAAEG